MIFSYARVSTWEQAAEGTTSIGEQERRNRAVASIRSAGAFDFVAYADEGVSGSIPLKDRPAGRELLSAAKKGDVIVATKLDRLFRSALDALQTVKELKEQGIDLILIDIGLDPVSSNGAAKLFFGILSMVAEFERERITERFEDGKRAKKAQHNGTGHSGGSVPYGYRAVGKGREARLEIDENEMGLLKIVGDLAVKIESPWVIGKRLTLLNFRDRKGHEFRIPQVRRLIERAREIRHG